MYNCQAHLMHNQWAGQMSNLHKLISLLLQYAAIHRKRVPITELTKGCQAFKQEWLYLGKLFLKSDSIITDNSTRIQQEGQNSPLQRMARLSPRASAVLELMFSTTLCFTFFNTAKKVRHKTYLSVFPLTQKYYVVNEKLLMLWFANMSC